MRDGRGDDGKKEKVGGDETIRLCRVWGGIVKQAVLVV